MNKFVFVYNRASGEIWKLCQEMAWKQLRIGMITCRE